MRVRVTNDKYTVKSEPEPGFPNRTIHTVWDIDARRYVSRTWRRRHRHPDPRRGTKDRDMSETKLTVYRGNVVRGATQVEVCIAAPSKAAAMRELGVSRTEFANHWGKTGNPTDVAAALSRPGERLWKPCFSREAPIPWDQEWTS